MITCRIESDLYGTGLTRGIGEIRPNEDGSKIKADVRYVMRFPSSLADVADQDLGGFKCDKVN